MKKIVSLLLIAICLFTASCGAAEKVLSVSVDELFGKISAVNAEGDMYAYSATRLENDILITSDLFTEGKFMVPEEGAGVETIAFFKAKDEDSAKTIKAALNEFVQKTQTDQKDYNADNYAVALKGEVYTEGLYVYMVMSPAKDAIITVINEYLK